MDILTLLTSDTHLTGTCAKMIRKSCKGCGSYALETNSPFDLSCDLGHTDLGHIRYTWSCNGRHLCKVHENRTKMWKFCSGNKYPIWPCPMTLGIQYQCCIHNTLSLWWKLLPSDIIGGGCLSYEIFTDLGVPGSVAQSVTCLATDACLTADPGVASSIPVRSHTFVEIDHEMISTIILLPSANSFKKGCCQLQAKVCARITG